ncbi:hypothetical protein BHM03_00056621 [Ensete ventricosum]|nr:hypothetical protein BHM03_00056621 [Ensete ventricosum]
MISLRPMTWVFFWPVTQILHKGLIGVGTFDVTPPTFKPVNFKGHDVAPPRPAAIKQSPSRLRFLVTETHAKPIPGSESIPRRPALTSGSICEIEVSLPFPDSKRTSSNLVLGIGRTMVLWVFGYGSLVCNPGFEFDEKIIGFIKDYRRVFDLGKVFVDDRQLSRIPSLKEYTDRYALGTPEFPARTCTLEPEKGAICWGVAYCVKGGAEKERAAVKEGKTSDPAATGVIV